MKVSNWYRLSIDDRIKVDTEIRNELREKKNGKYSQSYPERLKEIEYAVANNLIMDVTDF